MAIHPPRPDPQVVGAMVTVTPELLADQPALFGYVSDRLSFLIMTEMVAHNLRPLVESLTIEAHDGGFWSDVEWRWYERPLAWAFRWEPRTVWTPMLMYRATMEGVPR